MKKILNKEWEECLNQEINKQDLEIDLKKERKNFIEKTKQ